MTATKFSYQSMILSADDDEMGLEVNFDEYRDVVKKTVEDELRQVWNVHDNEENDFDKSVEISLMRHWNFYVKRHDQTKYPSDSEKANSLNYTYWCVICGDDPKSRVLIKCKRCCASFHAHCANMELKEKDYDDKSRMLSELGCLDKGLCNQCSFGEELSAGDIVWHKLQGYSWWPARILGLNEKPDCLINRPSAHHLPVKYFGENNHAWADSRQMLSFKMNFTTFLKKSNSKLKAAIVQITK